MPPEYTLLLRPYSALASPYLRQVSWVYLSPKLSTLAAETLTLQLTGYANLLPMYQP